MQHYKHDIYDTPAGAAPGTKKTEQKSVQQNKVASPHLKDIAGTDSGLVTTHAPNAGLARQQGTTTPSQPQASDIPPGSVIISVHTSPTDSDDSRTEADLDPGHWVTLVMPRDEYQFNQLQRFSAGPDASEMAEVAVQIELDPEAQDIHDEIVDLALGLKRNFGSSWQMAWAGAIKLLEFSFVQADAEEGA